MVIFYWGLFLFLVVLFLLLVCLVGVDPKQSSLPLRGSIVDDDLGQAEQIPPLLIVAEAEEKLPKMYSFSRLQFFELPLPELRGDDQKTLLSSKGWIFIIDKINLEMSLFHPILSAGPRILLPAGFKDTEKAVLSSTPSESANFTVGVIHSGGKVATWRPGEPGWTGMTGGGKSKCCDLIFYDRQLYGCNMDGSVFVCDMTSGRAEQVAAAPGGTRIGRRSPSEVRCNLVESSGKLLGVYWVEMVEMDQYPVFELDLKSRTWRNSVQSLEDRALFLGPNSSSFSLQVTAQTRSSFRPSCIYFADNNSSFGVSVHDMRRRFARKEDLLPRQHRFNAAQPLWVQHFALIS